MSDDTNNKVLSILEDIKSDQRVNSTTTDTSNKVKSTPAKANKSKNEPPRGNPKSGRFWKTKKERFATINKTKGLRNDFQKKTALRIEMQRVKELSKQAQEELKQKELERKERRKQNILKAEENKRKSEIVQVITNTAKIKRMRKKQLRFIQKRDTNKEIEANK